MDAPREKRKDRGRGRRKRRRRRRGGRKVEGTKRGSGGGGGKRQGTTSGSRGYRNFSVLCRALALEHDSQRVDTPRDEALD